MAPGHGSISGPELLDKQQRYFVELRRQVAAGIEAGKPVAQIRESLEMPFYREWTGVNVRNNVDNITHAYNELLGIAPPHYLTRDLGLHEGPSLTKADAGWTAPKKVLVPNLAPGRLESLRAVAPGVELVVYRTPDEAARLVADADGVIGACSRQIVEAGPQAPMDPGRLRGGGAVHGNSRPGRRRDRPHQRAAHLWTGDR